MKFKLFSNIHLTVPLIGCLLLVGLEFNTWFLALIGGILLWRYLGENEKLPLPPPWLTNTLSVVVFGLVLMTYRTLFDREAAPLFFSCLCAVKVLEYRSLRDHKLIVALLMFLLSTKFLFTIDIWMIPFVFWFSYHLWSALMVQKMSVVVPSSHRRGFIFRVFIASLPIALILYFIFPRLNSYLLQSNLGQQKNMAMTGFGDEIRPGSISDLAQRKELVFRAEFTNSDYIDLNHLYWRGLVLRRTDGFRWFQGAPLKEPSVAIAKTEVVQYTVTMEPNRQKWTFPLDLPISLTGNGSFPVLRLRNNIFQTHLPIEARTIFSGTSVLNVNQPADANPEYLEVPTLSKRVLALAKKLKGNASSRDQIVKNIHSYFRDNNFLYTLSPGRMDEKNIDDFVFNVKKGFCEHFAGAFGILARAAGVPARVVIGYQGGELNKLGDFITVSSQDAHAWNEYINDKGQWQRTDVVESVAPLRTSLGAAEFLQLPEDARGFEFAAKKRDQDFFSASVEFISMYFETMNFFWTRWLLDFNFDRQLEFLSFIPIPFALMLLLSVGLIFFSFVAFRLWTYWSDKAQLVELTYRRLLVWAQENGFKKEDSEGPLSFLQRLKSFLPELEPHFNLVIGRYIEFTFAEKNLSYEQIVEMAQNLRRIEKAFKRSRRLKKSPHPQEL